MRVRLKADFILILFIDVKGDTWYFISGQALEGKVSFTLQVKKWADLNLERYIWEFFLFDVRTEKCIYNLTNLNHARRKRLIPCK